MTKKAEKLPKHCADCGGEMLYAKAFGRVFSCCSCCSPVVDMTRVAKAARIGEARRDE
jgi:hypothetical protein